MKFDMHCHVIGGSVDSHITAEKYIEILKSLGFSGMMITDHDSYKGYDGWLSRHPKGEPDFIVLRGIEYDTRNAGHFLVIMPDGVDLKVLTLRGMSVRQLIYIVHKFGGVLGPAHPFGARSSSAMFCRTMKRDHRIAESFDFIEGFNTCETATANRLARIIADRYRLQCTGGSDSHRDKYVGTAFTVFDRTIRCNNDLIACIKEHGIVAFGGTERQFLFVHKFRNHFYTTWAFKVFNRTVGFFKAPVRRYHLKHAKGIK